MPGRVTSPTLRVWSMAGMRPVRTARTAVGRSASRAASPRRQARLDLGGVVAQALDEATPGQPDRGHRPADEDARAGDDGARLEVEGAAGHEHAERGERRERDRPRPRCAARRAAGAGGGRPRTSPWSASSAMNSRRQRRAPRRRARRRRRPPASWTPARAAATSSVAAEPEAPAPRGRRGDEREAEGDDDLRDGLAHGAAGASSSTRRSATVVGPATGRASPRTRPGRRRRGRAGSRRGGRPPSPSSAAVGSSRSSDVGIARERAGDGDARLLAAREHRGGPVGVALVEVGGGERRGDVGARRRRGGRCRRRCRGACAGAGRRGRRAGAARADRGRPMSTPSRRDLARVGAQQTVAAAQERALARARGRDERGHRAGDDLERRAVEDEPAGSAQSEAAGLEPGPALRHGAGRYVAAMPPVGAAGAAGGGMIVPRCGETPIVRVTVSPSCCGGGRRQVVVGAVGEWAAVDDRHGDRCGRRGRARPAVPHGSVRWATPSSACESTWPHAVLRP